MADKRLRKIVVRIPMEFVEPDAVDHHTNQRVIMFPVMATGTDEAAKIVAAALAHVAAEAGAASRPATTGGLPHAFLHDDCDD